MAAPPVANPVVFVDPITGLPLVGGSAGPYAGWPVVSVDGSGVASNPIFPNVGFSGDLTFADAVSEIVPGATSFNINNHADTVANLTLTDAGVLTVNRGPINAGPTVTTNGTTQGSRSNLSLTFSGLTQAYAGTTAAFDAATTTDTGAFNYTGIIRGGMGHVNVVSVGATIATTEGLAGVVFVDPTATGTMTDGYGGGGEIVHQGGAGFTVTNFTGLRGQVELQGAGNIGTGYGSYAISSTFVGSTGTYTTAMVGAFGLAQANTPVTIGRAIGGQFYVDLTVGATITGGCTGVQAYVQAISTAVDTPAIGLDAWVAWGSSTAIGLAYAIQAQIRNTGGATMSSGEGIHVLSPSATSGTITAARGIRVADQSGANITTGVGIRVDNQAATGGIAFQSAGGLHQWQSTANVGLSWTLSDGTTTAYTFDSRKTVSQISHSFTATPNTTGSPTLFRIVGPAHTTLPNAEFFDVNFNFARTVQFTGNATLALQRSWIVQPPTYTSDTATKTITRASTLAITGAPVASTNVTLTATYALDVTTGNVFFGGLLTTYNNIATQGTGIPFLIRENYVTTQTNATVTLVTYPVPAADGSYEVSASINCTSAGTAAMTVTVSYTDANNTAQTQTLQLTKNGTTAWLANGSIIATGDYMSAVMKVRCKASTTLSIQTAGTVTAVAYTGGGTIKQVA